MKLKLSLFLFLFFSNISFFYSQKVGIISDINSKMGYVVFKGELFTEKPIFEKDINYDLIDFLHQYYTDKNISSKNINPTGISFNGVFSKEIERFRNVCKENNLDQLLIISKNKSYTSNDPMLIYSSLNHELGIEAYVKTKTRAIMYGNFRIYLYNLADHTIKDVVSNVYIPHRFKGPVFDDKNYDLINDEVKKLFADDLEKLVTRKMDKFYSK
ncbi:hypothetical protein BA768_20405 [Chryseobacterium sp. CBo1]|uniref:hypothetical protein n=1 Tax=Chryseobacterium sp. CBo1 TaxID=1869230 RepID=UPI0008109BE3|nr:hypothetical protein [Chryseobacterium sp. CBo1]OCK50301.1 hypothetical protein BA768_20405 [Chryseobacterium sp. CBo1]